MQQQDQVFQQAKKVSQMLLNVKARRLALMVQSYQKQAIAEMQEPLKAYNNSKHQQFESNCSTVRGLIRQRKIKFQRAIQQIESCVKTFQQILEQIQEKKNQLDAQYDACREIISIQRQHALKAFRDWAHFIKDQEIERASVV